MDLYIFCPIIQHIIYTDGSVSFSVKSYKTLFTLMDLYHFLSNHTTHYLHWWICTIFCPIIQHIIHTDGSVSFSVKSYNTLFTLMDLYHFQWSKYYSRKWLVVIFFDSRSQSLVTTIFWESALCLIYNSALYSVQTYEPTHSDEMTQNVL